VGRAGNLPKNNGPLCKNHSAGGHRPSPRDDQKNKITERQMKVWGENNIEWKNVKPGDVAGRETVKRKNNGPDMDQKKKTEAGAIGRGYSTREGGE